MDVQKKKKKENKSAPAEGIHSNIQNGLVSWRKSDQNRPAAASIVDIISFEKGVNHK